MVDVRDRGQVGSHLVHPFVDVERAAAAADRRPAVLFAERRDEQHVRRRPVDLEVVAEPLFETRRRERPEALAVLDFRLSTDCIRVRASATIDDC
jgi:hypothetical protein